MLSLAIPTYERPTQTRDTYTRVRADARVSEIVIVDDGSRNAFSFSDPKVRVVRHENNVGCYLNKRRAVEAAENNWVYLLDSDNVAWPQGLDALQNYYPWEPDLLYIPTWAHPHFDYRDYSGDVVTRESIRPKVDAPRFLTALNTGNFFVNRAAYLEVFDESENPLAADSLYFCYCWLRSGKSIFFVPNFHYSHAVGGVSNYVRYAAASEPIFRRIEQALREGR